MLLERDPLFRDSGYIKCCHDFLNKSRGIPPFFAGTVCDSPLPHSPFFANVFVWPGQLSNVMFVSASRLLGVFRLMKHSKTARDDSLQTST